jgi:hypothetical protein
MTAVLLPNNPLNLIVDDPGYNIPLLNQPPPPRMAAGVDQVASRQGQARSHWPT